MTFSKETILKLLTRCAIDPITGCWNWTGAKHDSRGYAYASIAGKQYYVHRLAAHIHLDMSLTDRKQQANHECDNPGCIRCAPGHIYVGTQGQNLREMFARGRQNRNNYVRGEAHGRSVLTREKVLRIRELRASGEKLAAIAVKVGVKRGSIPDILAGRTWGHV